MGNKISRCIPARQRKRKAEGNEQVAVTEHGGQDQDGGFQQGGLTQTDPPSPNNEVNTDSPIRDDEPPEDSPIGPPKLIYVSLYAFRGRNEGDLSFVKGEKIEILNNADGDWWYGKSCRTKLTGYVPSNYIEPINSLKSHDRIQ